jgi:Protein of unknown function (DUF3606)
MADNNERREPESRQRINIDESSDVDYWCQEFELRPTELKEVVLRSGSAVAAVRETLKRRAQGRDQ